MIISLIDGDAIPYIVGYNLRELEPDASTISEAHKSVDSIIDMIFTMTGATHYLPFYGNEQRHYFRHYTYNYASYKGNRPPEADWYIRWSTYIRDYMRKYWEFICNTNLEADDLISWYHEDMLINGISLSDMVICSNDKDLRQIPGIFYDYKKAISEDISGMTSPLVQISKAQAWYKLWQQVIMGDSTDNIAGVPGLGEIKAQKLLDAANDPIEYPTIARSAFCKYFGQYYGPIIFDETVAAITLAGKNHPYKGARDVFDDNISELAIPKPIKRPKTGTNPFE